MGSERMWLRHFAHKAKTKTFRDYEARYFRFEAKDVVELCNDHHEEIHQIYIGIINIWCQNKRDKPLWKYSWKEAEELMSELRKVCKKWLKSTSPGVKKRRR